MSKTALENRCITAEYIRKVTEMASAWTTSMFPIDYSTNLNPYSPKEVNRQLTHRRNELNREIEHYRSLIE